MGYNVEPRGPTDVRRSAMAKGGEKNGGWLMCGGVVQLAREEREWACRGVRRRRGRREKGGEMVGAGGAAEWFFRDGWISEQWCSLEHWYYRILILMTGNLKNAEIALDALSICMSINGWEMMIPFAFFAGAGVRVANELGAGNGRGAKFATIIAVMTSVAIGLFFWLLVLIFHQKISFIFSTSPPVIEEVKKLSVLLAFTILLNSVQPVLSGVAVGSGWQSTVAFINLGCYYLLGVPLGFLMGWKFDLGVMGIWSGMVFGGTAVQTVILVIITIRCDWEKEAQRASVHVQKWADGI
ncbi:hypothetical protein BVRB_6g138890 [Beta vulgaris subsp. vulgaris]|nr:hypothetical protein BVRB_6g138890 [Beta vulgaris subsp. vulgaris]